VAGNVETSQAPIANRPVWSASRDGRAPRATMNNPSFSRTAATSYLRDESAWLRRRPCKLDGSGVAGAYGRAEPHTPNIIRSLLDLNP